MEIQIAQYAGFCEGVERAYKIALENSAKDTPVYMLGNLVHNTQVVEDLINRGVMTVKTISEIPKGKNGILLISAHGVSPEIYKEAESKGLKVVDTTCPWVKNAQKLAEKLSNNNLQLIIVGDREHPEVKGLQGWSNNKAIVVQNADELSKIPAKCLAGTVGVIAQTTQSESNFNAVVNKLKESSKNLVVHKTICGATEKRQKAAVELAQKVDLMLVIGDRKSANTKRLTELCLQAGTETHQIQTVAELDRSWLEGKNKIGITAGASTPEWVIQEIIGRLKRKQI